MPVLTKICGLSTQATLDAAIAGGASHAGFVFYPPSPRAVTFDATRALRTPAHVRRVGVFVDPCNALLDQAIEAGQLDVLQLHAATPARVAAIAQCGIEVWAAVAIKTRNDLAAARAYAGAARRVLYDAKTPVNALPGGVGLRFDWSLLAGFSHPLPWALSGGLDADNLAEAVRVTGASLVDVSSGVESAPGVKDVDKIAAFLESATSL